MGVPAAGCVDPNTFGHVRWQQACVAAGVEPLFGVEIAVQDSDSGRQPQAWALAKNPGALYGFYSSRPTVASEWAGVSGVVRFAGGALDDPEHFDYVDLNPESALANLRALALAKRTRRPLVVTSSAWYPRLEDRDTFLAMANNKRLAPQHILSEEELRLSMPEVPTAAWRKALKGTREVAERLSGTRLALAPIIKVQGNLHAEVERGRGDRLERGHIARWTEEYQQRLERELELIAEKGYESYFLVVGDLVRWAKQRMLVGPGRGSSAGSLVCYLLEITEVDPLPHGLLFERFIDVNRADLPDIDIDFHDGRRGEVFEYLRQRYGDACVARLGNVSTLQPRSVLGECGKRLGIPAHETYAVRDVLYDYSSGDSRYGAALEDTLRDTAPGRAFIERHPEAQVMLRAEGHAWHTSVHAAGVLVSTKPLTRYCSVIDGVCEVDKASAEKLGLLKIDVLGLRTLGVLEDTGMCTPEMLYGLALDSNDAFNIINEQRLAGVFQFEGAAQRRVAKQVPVTSFKQLDHITALARPGPLGGGATGSYIARNDGREPITYKHPSMERYLADTQGVVLYQEQVMRIVRELGGFTWAETSTIRKAMSGRKGVEFFNQQQVKFVAGAAERGIAEREAKQIWDEICSFGAWGMNRAHTVSYAIISYWCAWLKAHHPLEFAAALLRNAKDDEQVLETLRELESEGIEHVAFDPERSLEHWSAQDGRLVGGFRNLRGVGPVKARQLAERRGSWTEKERALVENAEVAFSELRPGRALWGPLYDDPDANGVRGPVKLIGELGDREEAVVVCKLVRKERRDQNETVRLQRRGGKRYRGQPLFLDAFVVDDSVTKPVLLRLNPRMWRRWGERLADSGKDGEDWFLVRGVWLAQFSMMSCEKIRCLTHPELFDA